MNSCRIGISAAKSRKDGILFSVNFRLRSAKTLFLPHSKNKTTLVTEENISINQPYYLINTKKNEVIRSIIWGKPFSIEVVPLEKSGGNEVINSVTFLTLCMNQK